MPWQPWVAAHDLLTYRLRLNNAEPQGTGESFSTISGALEALARLVGLVGEERVLDAGVWAVAE
jgi:hypothetical protein